jgi:TolB-like protein
MDSNGFWARLREARAVQGLLVYLGATWLILQLLDIFIDNLGLPAWTMAGAIALLTIGLVFQLAVVWVQALLLARRGEEGEIGDDPQSGIVGDAAASFTWARFALGGIFAFALLFGIGGAYILFVGPAEGSSTFAIDEGASPGVAVLPFAVNGPDLEELGEGIVSLLATNLDGVTGLRAIDSRTVLARWDELVGDRDRADQNTNLAVARAAGARYALLGSAIELGDDVRLQADVYDLSTGTRLDHRQIEGSPDDLFQLVDRISIEAIDAILGQQQDALQTLSVATVTTNSIPALKAYLEGEVSYRRSDFEGAREAYERAIQEDSTFALAHYQLANAWGWSNGPAGAGHRRGVQGRAGRDRQAPPGGRTLSGPRGGVVPARRCILPPRAPVTGEPRRDGGRVRPRDRPRSKIRPVPHPPAGSLVPTGGQRGGVGSDPRLRRPRPRQPVR